MLTRDFDPEWDTPRPPVGIAGIVFWGTVIISVGWAIKALFF